MTAPGGRRRAPEVRRRPLRPIALHLAVALVTGAAWIFLVRAAIDFGAMAKGGATSAWVFTALATVGATGCLLLAIVVVTRALALAGLVRENQPKYAGRRRR